MNCQQFCLLLLATCLLPPFSTSAAASLVEGVCGEVSKASPSSSTYSNCVQALESDPASSKASDYRALGRVALKLSISNTTDSLNFIRGMVKSNGSPPIRQCANEYEPAAASFRSALLALVEDSRTCNYDVKVSGEYITRCENGLKSARVSIPSISARNEVGILFSEICDVITSKIDFKHLLD